jgi:hypothetical protein
MELEDIKEFNIKLRDMRLIDIAAEEFRKELLATKSLLVDFMSIRCPNGFGELADQIRRKNTKNKIEGNK